MMRRSPFSKRADIVKEIEARIRNRSFPRLQMLLLVALTGAFGLLTSFCLLHFGLEAMAIRYPLSLAVSYLFFLFLIWLWIRTNAKEYSDLLDPNLVPSGRQSAGPDSFNGGGGDFGGGGASASFESPSVGLNSARAAPANSVGEAAGVIGDAEAAALVIPIVVIAVAAGLALASLYVVYVAPALFAEVLLDGALSYVLFRRLREQERRFWLTSAMRHTIVPFAITAAFLAVMGAAMSYYAPDATSVGQVIEYATASAAR